MSNPIVDRCDYRPGDPFENAFTVCKVLGEGSFGVVYLIKDSYGQQYALKVLRLWEVMAEMREPLETRFKREYDVGRLGSPNLVHALQYGKVKGNPYIVMEFCDGGDLTPYLGKSGDRFATICRNILEGLRALHSHDIVHRDLKPENVLFKGGIAALTDFGIAGDSKHRLTHRNILGRPDQIFGTYAYMPPEQAERRRGGVTVQPTTDIYSFGVVAFQLLTGQLPFGKLEEPADLVEYQRRSKEHIWNHSLLQTIPGGQQWYQLFDGTLQPDPKNRLQNVDEVMRLIPNPSAYSQTPFYGQPGNGSSVPPVAPVQPIPPVPPVRPVQSEQPAITRPGSQQAQLAKPAILHVLGGEEKGRTIPLSQMALTTQGRLTVGRSNDNHIVLRSPDCYVSRHHCTFQCEDGGQTWMLRDGQWDGATNSWHPSANGTQVNGHAVTPNGFYLSNGDRLRIGDVELLFELK